MIHRTLWFRVARLAHHRGAFDGVLDAGAMWQFLEYVANEADARGRLGEDRMPHLKAKFALARGWRSTRQAARYQRALLDLGWLRQTQRPAPGYRARFQLQIPLDLLPGDLPEDLARAMPFVWNGRDELPEPDDADAAYGHLTARTPVPVTLDPPQPPNGPQTAPDGPSNVVPLFPPGRVDLGPLPATRHLFDDILADALTDDPEDRPACLAVQSSSVTSLTRGPVTPVVYQGDHRGDKSDFRTATPPGRRWVPPPRPGAPDGDELAAAHAVLAQCEPWWTQQRGPGRGVLSRVEVAELAEAVAYALRRTTASEVVELATVGVRSARSLPHVVGARLWRLIRSKPEDWRARPAAVAVDEDGRRYAGMLAARAAAHSAQAASPVQRAAVEYARAAIDAVRAAAPAPEPARPRAPHAREDAAVQAAERAWDETMRDPLAAYRALAARPARRAGHDRIPARGEDRTGQ